MHREPPCVCVHQILICLLREESIDKPTVQMLSYVAALRRKGIQKYVGAKLQCPGLTLFTGRMTFPDLFSAQSSWIGPAPANPTAVAVTNPSNGWHHLGLLAPADKNKEILLQQVHTQIFDEWILESFLFPTSKCLEHWGLFKVLVNSNIVN